MPYTFNQISQQILPWALFGFLWLGAIETGFGQSVTITLKEYNRLKERSDRVTSLMKENTRLAESLADRNKQLARKEVEITKLKIANNVIKELKQKSINQSKEIAFKNQEITKLQQKIEQLRVFQAKTERKNQGLQKDKKTLQNQVKRLTKDKKELQVKETLLAICKREKYEMEKKKNDLENKVKSQYYSIQQLRKSLAEAQDKNGTTKLNLQIKELKTVNQYNQRRIEKLEENLKLSFIPTVQKFSRGLAYDAERAKRLQTRCENLQEVFSSQTPTLIKLSQNLAKYQILSQNVRAYQNVLSKSYNPAAQAKALQTNTTFRPVYQNQEDDLKEYRKAVENYCKRTGSLFNSVKAAKVYLKPPKPTPQKTRAKLREVLKKLDVRYVYLRKELNKNIRNLYYSPQIVKSKCN